MTEAEELELLQLKAKQQAGGGNNTPADLMAAFNSRPEANVVQEQHPDITFKDRMIVKNFATNPDTMVKYLASQHPDLQIEADPNGQIRVKRPDETVFRVVDPDTGVFSKDILNDVGDVAYDTLSGLGTGAATAAGGLAGAAAGGVGAIPGAAAAGAGASTAFEGARQGIGSLLGLKNNFDPGQVGMAAATGAISPLLFGTGASATNVAGKGLAGRLASLGGYVAPETEAAAENVLRTQSGLPGKLLAKASEKVLPKVASTLSGLPEQAIKDIGSNLGEIRQFEGAPELFEDSVAGSMKENLKKISDKESDVYKQLSAHIADKSGGQIDLREAIDPFWEHVKNTQKALAENPTVGSLQDEADTALKEFNQIWGKPKIKAGTNELADSFYQKTPEFARKAGQEIGDTANFAKGIAYKDASPAVKRVSAVAKDAYQGFNNSIEKAAEGAKDLRGQVSDIIKDKQYVYKNFSDPKKFISQAQKASTSKIEGQTLAARIKELDNRYGTNFDKTRGTISAIASTSKDSTTTRKSLAGLIGGLAGYGLGGGFIGGSIGSTVGAAAASPKSIKLLMELAQKSGGKGAGAFAKSAFVNQLAQKYANPSLTNLVRGKKKGR